MQLLEGELVLATTLVNMYIKCEMIAKSKKVLKGLLGRDTFSWNVLIVGYIKQNQVHEALVPAQVDRCKMRAFP